MELIAFIGSIYTVVLLLRASRKHGGVSSIPAKKITSISARFGVFIGIALAAKSMSIFLGIPAVPEGGWFLSGVITKAVLVGAFGIYIFVLSWRHAKNS